MLLLFNNTAAANIGNAGGLQPSSVAGSLYVSLHTGDPGTTGDQTVNEANYTGYARVAVARSGAGWTVTSATAANTAAVTFGLCTAGTNTIEYFGVGTAVSSTGDLLYSFPLTAAFFDSVGLTSGNTIYAPGHTLNVSDPVVFTTAIGGVMPGGISTGTIYYVKTVSGDAITISATLGGSTLTITTDGSAIIGKINTLAVSNGITPSFAINALTITES
jgi:hypothetical protein